MTNPPVAPQAASGFLLDTHAFQWWWCSPRLLSEPVREVLRDPAQRVLVSAASWLELAEAQRAGQLPGLEQALERFPQLLEADGLTVLPVWPRPSWRTCS